MLFGSVALASFALCTVSVQGLSLGKDIAGRNPSTWNRLSRRGLSDKQADLTHSQLAVATSSSHIKGQCSHERLAASTPNVSNATGLMPEVPHKRLTDQARVQVELHLQKILNEFQTATAHLEDCGCADQSHSSHNLVWYKKTIIDILINLQVTIKVVIDTGDEEIITIMKKLCAEFTIHIIKFIQMSIHVSSEIVTEIESHIDVHIFQLIGLQINQIIQNAQRESVSVNGTGLGAPLGSPLESAPAMNGTLPDSLGLNNSTNATSPTNATTPDLISPANASIPSSTPNMTDAMPFANGSLPTNYSSTYPSGGIPMSSGGSAIGSNATDTPPSGLPVQDNLTDTSKPLTSHGWSTKSPGSPEVVEGTANVPTNQSTGQISDNGIPSTTPLNNMVPSQSPDQPSATPSTSPPLVGGSSAPSTPSVPSPVPKISRCRGGKKNRKAVKPSSPPGTPQTVQPNTISPANTPDISDHASRTATPSANTPASLQLPDNTGPANQVPNTSVGGQPPSPSAQPVDSSPGLQPGNSSTGAGNDYPNTGPIIPANVTSSQMPPVLNGSSNPVIVPSSNKTSPRNHPAPMNPVTSVNHPATDVPSANEYPSGGSPSANNLTGGQTPEVSSRDAPQAQPNVTTSQPQGEVDDYPSSGSSSPDLTSAESHNTPSDSPSQHSIPVVPVPVRSQTFNNASSPSVDQPATEFPSTYPSGGSPGLTTPSSHSAPHTTPNANGPLIDKPSSAVPGDYPSGGSTEATGASPDMSTTGSIIPSPSQRQPINDTRNLTDKPSADTPSDYPSGESPRLNSPSQGTHSTPVVPPSAEGVPQPLPHTSSPSVDQPNDYPSGESTRPNITSQGNHSTPAITSASNHSTPAVSTPHTSIPSVDKPQPDEPSDYPAGEVPQPDITSQSNHSTSSVPVVSNHSTPVNQPASQVVSRPPPHSSIPSVNEPGPDQPSDYPSGESPQPNVTSNGDHAPPAVPSKSNNSTSAASPPTHAVPQTPQTSMPLVDKPQPDGLSDYPAGAPTHPNITSQSNHSTPTFPSNHSISANPTTSPVVTQPPPPSSISSVDKPGPEQPSDYPSSGSPESNVTNGGDHIPPAVQSKGNTSTSAVSPPARVVDQTPHTSIPPVEKNHHDEPSDYPAGGSPQLNATSKGDRTPPTSLPPPQVISQPPPHTSGPSVDSPQPDEPSDYPGGELSQPSITGKGDRSTPSIPPPTQNVPKPSRQTEAPSVNQPPADSPSDYPSAETPSSKPLQSPDQPNSQPDKPKSEAHEPLPEKEESNYPESLPKNQGSDYPAADYPASEPTTSDPATSEDMFPSDQNPGKMHIN